MAHDVSYSIEKALSPTEKGIKPKHIRNIIISTFKSNDAFCIIFLQPLRSHKFTAWKCCSLLLKILRDGHLHCVRHALAHKISLTELGDHWRNQRLPITAYMKIVLQKMEMHENFPQIPGNLIVSDEQWEQICKTNVQSIFELGIDMFNYMDEIITFTHTVFNSTQKASLKSGSPAWECRITALIPLIEECTQLYKCLLRVMFELHRHLPKDHLDGHKERFCKIFNDLKPYFALIQNEQHISTAVTIPVLLEMPPNFNLAEEFSVHAWSTGNQISLNNEPIAVAFNELAIVPEPSKSTVQFQMIPSAPVDFEAMLRERDETIQRLWMENCTLRQYLDSSKEAHQTDRNQAEIQISNLNERVAILEAELKHKQVKNEELQLKLLSGPLLGFRGIEQEIRTTAEEEKLLRMRATIYNEYIKISDAYGQILNQGSGTNRNQQ